MNPELTDKRKNQTDPALLYWSSDGDYSWPKTGILNWPLTPPSQSITGDHMSNTVA